MQESGANLQARVEWSSTSLLEKIKEKGDDIYEFISLAIGSVDQRPTAQQLLDHKWLMKKEEKKKTMVPRQVVEEEPEVPRPIVKEDEKPEKEIPLAADSGRKIVRVYSEVDTTEPPLHKRGASLDVRVKGTFLEDDSLRLRLRIADSSGQNRTVEFPFNTETDSAQSVATEMVEALSLESSAVEAIEREIEKEVKYLEEEKKGFCLRDNSRRHSADNSGESSPEAVARTQDTVSSQDRLAAMANVERSNFITRTPSTESLTDKARILLDDNTIVPQSQPMVAHEDHTSRPKSAFDALKQHDTMSLSQSAAGAEDRVRASYRRRCIQLRHSLRLSRRLRWLRRWNSLLRLRSHLACPQRRQCLNRTCPNTSCKKYIEFPKPTAAIEAQTVDPPT